MGSVISKIARLFTPQVSTEKAGGAKKPSGVGATNSGRRVTFSVPEPGAKSQKLQAQRKNAAYAPRNTQTTPLENRKAGIGPPNQKALSPEAEKELSDLISTLESQGPTSMAGSAASVPRRALSAAGEKGINDTIDMLKVKGQERKASTGVGDLEDVNSELADAVVDDLFKGTSSVVPYKMMPKTRFGGPSPLAAPAETLPATEQTAAPRNDRSSEESELTPADERKIDDLLNKLYSGTGSRQNGARSNDDIGSHATWANEPPKPQ